VSHPTGQTTREVGGDPRPSAARPRILEPRKTRAGLGPKTADDPKPVTFDDNVAGILKKTCLQCHGEAKQEAGLNFATYASVVQGGSGGVVVVAGRLSASRLLEVITAEDPDARMPPDNEPAPTA
jgi:Planctomycete cytochrome C